MIEKKYLVALYAFTSFGPVRAELMLQYFGSAEKAWNASHSQLSSIGLSPQIVSSFAVHRREFDFDKYFSELNRQKINVITKHEKEYPRNLLGIASAPIVLYVCGSLDAKDINSVALVGARKMTQYGREVTEQFSHALAGMGVTIVSGLALGIDAVAHRSALSSGGRTVAVMARGLDAIYPATNHQLARDIVESGSGAIISEYPLGYPALKNNFVQRNRIISGLSKAVVVVEGRQKSGTLLTARHAAEQGRTVFAIPGQITSPMSEAPFFLIGEGAKMAIRPEDILEELDMQLQVDHEALERVLPSDESEILICELLENGPLHIDEIVRTVKKDTTTVMAKLTMMEIKGMVVSVGSGEYRRRG